MRLSPEIIRTVGLRRFLQFVLHLPRFVKLFSRLARDDRVSLWPKMLLLFVLAYVVVPADVVPDFLPVLGQLDDLVVIFAGLRLFLRLSPEWVVREHVQAIAAGR
jgi:uncharacterized membrane protein YkvA (DUF1232 family)